MDEDLRKLVRQRAAGRCEYCHLPQSVHDERFSIDHVIPRVHGGGDAVENLALSCLRCNLHKGTNLSGIDAETSRIVRLFNPRSDDWEHHFEWSGPTIVGLTPSGRATVAVLRFNAVERVRLRAALRTEGKISLE